MLRSGTNSAFFFVSAVQYLLSMMRCGICSHTRFIDRFMMSESGDHLSFPFTSKTGQSHSVAQNRQTVLFLLYLDLKKGHTCILAFYRHIPDFRPNGYSIKLKERYCLPLLIDFYASIPAILDFRCHLSRHYENSV